ncbi:MAG: putative toxin-antitoxin system toxin component, PIN family [Thermoanaerobaculia bacterium]|nr:putative toxin-antitoxin system toxin component, PIN family [Thermoanaerobaculia bacterium]MBP9823538.1 putative toxin-antitoxin system toxin component, PIN family [Thermoanaerobaculia bacterium]
MRIVLDTNVFVSAVFFGGLPGRILEAWRDGRVQLVLSAEILAEYQRVGQILSTDHAGVHLEPFLGLLAVAAEFVVAPVLPRTRLRRS